MIPLRHITLGRTPLDKWSSPTWRPLPDSTQHSQETDRHPLVGFKPTIPASEQSHTHAL